MSSRKKACQGGSCLLNPLDLPIVCQQCPAYDHALLRRLKQESSPIVEIVREPRECPVCGKFFLDRANKMYCSSHCSKRAYSDRRKARTSDDKMRVYEWRNCEVCGKPYYPHTDNQRTCGGSCSEEYMRKVYNRTVDGISLNSVRLKHLSRLSRQKEVSMPATVLTNPVFAAQFKRHEEIDYVPTEDLLQVVRYLDANHGWWNSLNLPRQAAVLNLAYAVGLDSFGQSFRSALLFIRQCRWGEVKTAILSTVWTRSNGPRAVELARQLESGQWQEDPLASLGKEEDELEQGSLV